MKPSHYTGIITLLITTACLPLCLHAQGLHLTPEIHLVMNGAPALVLNNASLVNDGNLDAGNGAVLFAGDAATGRSFIGGATPIAFYDLTIGKSANDLRLNNNVAVSGRITLGSGNLQLNNYTLDLGSSGIIIGKEMKLVSPALMEER